MIKVKCEHDKINVRDMNKVTLPVFQFEYDRSFFESELEEIRDRETELRANKTSVYIPFSEGITESKEEILYQIQQDESAFNTRDVFDRIQKEWSICSQRILQALFAYDNSKKFHWLNAYCIRAVLYGPIGYYYEPNQVRIRLCNVDEEEALETITHELIHLLVEHRIRDMSYEQRERYVDETFIQSGLMELFPHYKVQFS